MDSVIDLIQTTYTKDDYGVPQASDVPREVFCEVQSITRAEFSSAGRNGLNPSYVFSVFIGDYHGERIVRYDGDTYSVYRTYRRADDDYIELYVERKGGTNGAQDAG